MAEITALKGSNNIKWLIPFVILFSLLMALTAAAREIVMIDAGVADVQPMVADLVERRSHTGRAIEVFVLDGRRDGMEQLAELLRSHRELDALHLIAHGNAARLQLGSSMLTIASMRSEHANELEVIRSAISKTGDILIYGCNFGQGEPGQRAAELLARATGADIAASDDTTGHASLGGDWELETRVGRIEARTIIAASWRGVLLDKTVDIQATTQAATPSSYTAGGSTYTFGNSNDLLLTGVTGASGTQYNVNLTGSRVVLNTVNNDSVSGGPRIRLFAQQSAGSGDFNFAPSLPGSPGAFDVADILGGTILNRGALDIFMNDDTGVELAGNVERLDYIFDSGITTPVNAALLNEGGHLYIEKSANNAAQVAAILSLDIDGNPSSYGPLLTIATGSIQTATINGAVNTFAWSFLNDTLSTGIDPMTGGSIYAAGANPVQTQTSNEQIGGAVITFADLGLSTGQIYYGLSYFDGSISQTDVNNGTVNLVTLAGFDTDTNTNFGGADCGGGLGRILISNAAAAATPPVANDDHAETQVNTPVTLSVTANDTSSSGAIDVATVDLDPVTPGMQTSLTIAGEGQFSADGTGNVTFTPAASFIGVSTATYTVDNDSGTTSNPATITITVVSFDYGDAPDTGAGTGSGNYATLATDNGPAHALGAGSPYMGGCVDGDSGTLQDGIAFADDFNDGSPDFGFCLPPTDDDDGVVLTAAMVAGSIPVCKSTCRLGRLLRLASSMPGSTLIKTAILVTQVNRLPTTKPCLPAVGRQF